MIAEEEPLLENESVEEVKEKVKQKVKEELKEKKI